MKKWKKPLAEEVAVTEDSTTVSCKGKRIGCYAGSSCGSVKKEEPAQQGETERK